MGETPAAPFPFAVLEWLACISHRRIVDLGEFWEKKQLERPSFLCHNYVVEALLWLQRGRPFL
jgi:hypothetical protein